MKNKAIFKILLLLSSIIISLLLAEFFLRIISPMSPYHESLPLLPHNKMRLEVNLKGLSPVVMHSTNKLGLRGDEPPAEWGKFYTIITIGGSATQCFYLDDRKTWPYLLQEKLKMHDPNIWVGNGGLDGQTTRSHIIFMKKVIAKLKPYAVILLTGVNDMGLSLSDDFRIYGTPYDYTRFNLKQFIFKHSRLAQVLIIWKRVIFNNAYLVKKNLKEEYVFKPLTDKPSPLPADLKSCLPSLSEYEKNIIKIIQIAKGMNIRVIFVTQPLLFSDNEYWRNREADIYWIRKPRLKISAATYWNFMDIFNQRLIEVCNNQNVLCFDLASEIPHSGLYFYDSMHFTEKGAEFVSDRLSAFLMEKWVIKNKDR